MEIEVNLDILDTVSQEVDLYLDDYVNYLNDSKKSVTDLNEEWEGDSYLGFSNKMFEFFDDMNKGLKALESYNSFLKSYVSQMNQLEETYEKKIITLV